MIIPSGTPTECDKHSGAKTITAGIGGGLLQFAHVPQFRKCLQGWQQAEAGKFAVFGLAAIM
jgi:hypothetical protein